MMIYHSPQEINFAGCALALGNFDGLHVAHMKVIQNCMTYAADNNLKSGVLLFDRHSSETAGDRTVALIMTIEQKLEILERAGVDFVYMQEFNHEFMNRTPEEFAAFIAKTLHAKAVCVGYDYRFGHKAAGDTDMLLAYGAKYGMYVSVTAPVCIEDRIVGSSAVREFIERGEIEQAAVFLGRYFFVEGKVVHGLQNGRKMGIPTANIEYSQTMLIPGHGVYAGITTVDGVKYRSVINVGTNKTFHAKKITIESHILGFDKDIYGQIIRVEFVKRLRGVKKFLSVDELKNEIHRNIQTAMEIIL